MAQVYNRDKIDEEITNYSSSLSTLRELKARLDAEGESASPLSRRMFYEDYSALEFAMATDFSLLVSNQTFIEWLPFAPQRYQYKQRVRSLINLRKQLSNILNGEK